MTKLSINLNDLLRQRTVEAKGDTEQELLSLAAKVPFDDRYNQSARLDDLSKPLMQAFLQEVDSALAADAPGLSVEVLARQMNVAGGAPAPLFETDDDRLSFVIRLPSHPLVRGGITPTDEVTAQVSAQVGAFCLEPRSAREIMDSLGLKHWKTFQRNYLSPLLVAGFLERAIPDKPNSRLQKYRLTQLGRQRLETSDAG